MEKRRKTLRGQVTSARMDKTVVVVVESPRKHPFYKKVVTHRAKFKAHDENNLCRRGDVVQIVETRPLSKQKRWRVAETVSRAEEV